MLAAIVGARVTRSFWLGSANCPALVYQRQESILGFRRNLPVSRFTTKPEHEKTELLYTRGLAYRDGIRVKKNVPRAADLFLQAANEGNTLAQVALGELYSTTGEGIETNYSEALQWFKKAANKGYEPAYFKLGAFFYEVKHDFTKAFEWFR
jgi:TPR repeat protein